MAQMMIARTAGSHMARVVGYAALPVMLGPILGPIDCRSYSATRLLALALPGQSASRRISDCTGRSLSA